MGHVESESRSLGQIIDKSCLHSMRHIYGPIFMKLCQKDCLDNDPTKFESGSCSVRK